MRGPRAAVALVALALLLAACGSTAETPAATETPTPLATDTPTPTATVTPTATETVAPATPSPPPTPTPTATPAPTPTVVPTPTPTATPAPTPPPVPMPTREELGIREVETDWAAFDLLHVRHGRGEPIPWEAGLYLLDVETGTVEGWVRPGGDAVVEIEGQPHASAPVAIYPYLSPGKRFVLFGNRLYDRRTGRTYRGEGFHIDRENYISEIDGWGWGDEERIIYQRPGGTAWFAILDGSLEATALFAIPGAERARFWVHPKGQYLFARDERHRLHLIAPKEGTSTGPSKTWFLPVRHDERYTIQQFTGGVAVVYASSPAGSEECRIALYRWDGTEFSRSVRCHGPAAWRVRISPDGGMLATGIAKITFEGYHEYRNPGLLSISDVYTGREVFRVKGSPAGWTMLDSTPYVYVQGWVATAAGEWAGMLPDSLASSDAPARFATMDSQYSVPQHISVSDRDGNVLASVDFVESRRILGLTSTWIRWGTSSRELRISLGIFYEGDGPNPHVPISPVIELPPFDDRLLVEVVVEGCLNLREEPSRDAPVTACLPDGTRAETDAYTWWPEEGWMRLLTDDGATGWAHADYLRWASNVVRLEE